MASGGNDNVVNVWDGRMTNSPKMSKTNHTAAVKVSTFPHFGSNSRLTVCIGTRMVSLDSSPSRFGWWIIRPNDSFLEYDHLRPSELPHYPLPSDFTHLQPPLSRAPLIARYPRSSTINLVVPLAGKDYRHPSSARDEDSTLLSQSGWNCRCYRLE